jgi:tetratricopeptide (TPR) repeat protein
VQNLEESFAELLTRVTSGETSLAAELNMDPRVLEKILERALALLRMGKLEAAENLLYEISHVETRAFVPCILLGWCRAQRGDFTHAIRAYDTALARGALFGASELMQRLFVSRALAYQQLGDLERAKSDLAVAAKGENASVATVARTLIERMVIP